MPIHTNLNPNSTLTSVISYYRVVNAVNGNWENRNQNSEFTWNLVKSDTFSVLINTFHVPSFRSFTLTLKGNKSGAMSQNYHSLFRSWLLSASLRNSPTFPSCSTLSQPAYLHSVFPPNFHISPAAPGFALYHFNVVLEWQMRFQLSSILREYYNLKNLRNAFTSLWNWC